MRFLIAIAFLGFAAANNEVCYRKVDTACDDKTLSVFPCNAIYGGFQTSESDLQSYMNSQLTTSYDYLLMSTYFNSYQKNRPGFRKVLNELSERAWNNAISLIKHITKRGGEINFNQHNEIPSTIMQKKRTLEVDELQSMALALDYEKELAKQAHKIHYETTHERHKRDPEIAHYIEEKFLEDQAEVIRKLSGYANDLSKLSRTQDPSLGIYLFDEYLQKH